MHLRHSWYFIKSRGQHCIARHVAIEIMLALKIRGVYVCGCVWMYICVFGCRCIYTCCLDIALVICHHVTFSSLQVKSQYTSGKASRSFTSTTFTPVTTNECEYVQVEKNPKKKGYVRLHTTHGDLNLELHCDITPRTCENFLTLCERGYYDGVIFHRNIRYWPKLVFHQMT